MAISVREFAHAEQSTNETSGVWLSRCNLVVDMQLIKHKRDTFVLFHMHGHKDDIKGAKYVLEPSAKKIHPFTFYSLPLLSNI